jgi:hypothetical protein
MKTLIIGLLAVCSLSTMGSSVKYVRSLSFSGVRYLSVVDDGKRLDDLYDRFNSLCLNADVKASDVNVKKVNNTWCVLVGDKVLVSVTKADAKVHNSYAQKLAEKWASTVSKNVEDVKPIR